VFIFRNRGGESLRIFAYDGQGFWMCQKRLSQGKFRYWPTENGERINRMAVHELQLLIWNVNPTGKTARLWKEIPVVASG
jgi:transposase